jgi:hypothetical protein
VVGAIRVGAGGFRGDTQISAQTRSLLGDALVTLERRRLATAVAFEYRILPASTDDAIAVASLAAPGGLGGRRAEVLTEGILTTVDLDPAMLGWNPRPRTSGRFLLHRAIPL